MANNEGELAAGHIALPVGQAPDTDLERQIADMKRRWQELQQALSSTSTSSPPSSFTTTTTVLPTPDAQHRQSAQSRRSSPITRRTSARKLSPLQTSPSLKTTTATKQDTASATPHLLVEGQDDEYQQHQGHGNDLDEEEEEESSEDVDDEDEDEDDEEDDSGSDKKKKRKRSGGGGGAKKRRMSYSYNVDDRKAWRKRQVGIDGLTDEERWTQRMSELESFKRRFGHVNVPQKWNENQKLANWLKNVRQRWTHVPNYLTPDKELILAELGVKKCEPLDIIIAKAKGRGGGGGGGKRKRSSSSGAAGDDIGSSDDSGSADNSSSARDGEAEKDGDDYAAEDEDLAEGPIKKKTKTKTKRRRRSAPEPREMHGAKKIKNEEGDEETRQQIQTAGEGDGLRRSGRRRKPLFDLEHLDLVQRQHLYDHQTRVSGRSKRATSARSTETSPLPPDGNDE